MDNLKNDIIEELCEKEKAREKLPVFYGSYDNYYHGFREVLNNAVDEILNNFENGEIVIKLYDDCRTISVSDTGRGIPINTKDNVKKLFETLFASGKYEANSKTNSGVNGVGNTILMYTSEYFECTSKMITEKKIYNISYENGEISKELSCLGDTEEHGTEIKFRLDPTIYTETIFSNDVISDIINKVSLVSDDIRFIYIHNGEAKIYENNIYDFFERNSKDTIGENEQFKTGNFERKVEVERKGKKEIVDETLIIDLIFATCSSEEPFKMNMLNGNNLIEFGTIHDGVLDGFKTYINNYCKQEKLYKKNEKNITNIDIENAISYACRVFNNLVEFESQVKFSTKKDYYKQCTKEYIIENLEIYKLEKEKQFKRLVDQVLICKRANDVNIKARQKVKDKLTEEINYSNKPEGLYDCSNIKGKGKRRLFICEGDSAANALLQSRNRHTDAILALTGKILNCHKANPYTIFNNNIILNIYRILGCGVELKTKDNKEFLEFNIDNLRYDEIIIATDADVDGFDIRCLVATMMWIVSPSLILNKKVWFVESPLYEIETKDNMYYAIDDHEKNIILSSIGNSKYSIERNKGLGQMDKDSCKETLMKLDYNGLKLINPIEIEKMHECFDLFMSEDIETRRNYIIENFDKYENVI